ncbi:MAG TPA: 2-oxo acid dehydrogenase subunit E2, partial [Nocardioidaceae bacterium]
MAESSQSNPVEPSAFGANEWLVDEMFERYQQDPNSVDKAWWEFFKNYTPGEHVSGKPVNPNGAKSAPAPEQKAEQKAAAKPAEKPAAPAPQKKSVASANPRADQTPAKATPKAGAPVPKEPEPAQKAEAKDEPQLTVLRGAPARTAQNMDASLSVPTATSVRSVPVKLLWDNRTVINNHLARARGGKVSFTHLIGYALVKALKSMPEMNNGFDIIDGKPNLITPAHINLGLAIDQQKPDGTRQLLVPSIKAAESMDFAAFWTAYEDIIRKARNNKLAVSDFQGTTISLTNPGTIGTNHSVPRLMKGQGTIIGVGAMEYPPEYQGASEETLVRNAVSKVMTLTSTYDHRVIQGAQSGEFLRRIHQLLLGAEGFYDEVFQALRIPYEPVRWVRDIPAGHQDDLSKVARVHELIHAYRVRGHLMADTDPLEYK